MLWLLLACGPPSIPEGQTTLAYTVRSWEGEPLGEILLGEHEGDRVEHLDATLADGARYRLDARLDAAGGWEAVVHRDARWERHALSLAGEGTRWSRWRGLERLGGLLPTPAQALVDGYHLDALPGAGNSLLAWSLLIDDLPAEGSSLLEAVDPRSGRAVPLGLSLRERRAVQVGDETVQARRYFAWTGGHGYTLWVDLEGRLLSLSGLLEVGIASVHGFSPPAPLIAEPPPGVVVEPLTVRRPDLVLRGRRDRPEGQAPRGTVLLLHGSGPGTRDGDYGPVRAGVFRQLSAALVARGWEVLRYDKRGIGESQPEGEAVVRSATLADLTADAAAWQELGGPCQILVGHSEGAYIAVERAVQDPRVTGVILLAGPARRVDAVMRDQLRLVLSAQGAQEDEIALASRGQRAWLSGLSRADRDGAEGGDILRQWMRSHVAHDQEAAIAALSVPLLAIYGEDDLQVPPGPEVERLRALLGEQAEVRVLPGLDHMLAATQAPLGLGAYADPDRLLDARVIATVLDWLDRQACR